MLDPYNKDRLSLGAFRTVQYVFIISVALIMVSCIACICVLPYFDGKNGRPSRYDGTIWNWNFHQWITCTISLVIAATLLLLLNMCVLREEKCCRPEEERLRLVEAAKDHNIAL